jgi:hypothetical protein
MDAGAEMSAARYTHSRKQRTLSIGLSLWLSVAILAGCGEVSKEPATIDRFVEAPRTDLVAAFEKSATARGYSPVAGGAWQKIMSYRKDPILGVVQISDDPAGAMWLVPEFVSVTPTASRIKLAPQTMQWLWPVAEKKWLYWSVGTWGHNEAVAIVDSAVAEAQTVYRSR